MPRTPRGRPPTPEPRRRTGSRPADRAPRRRARPVTTAADAGPRWSTALAAGAGPVAVDAERASGYRYGQRAYLVQLRRAGVGTVLIDPRRAARPGRARRRHRRRRVGAARRLARTCPAWPSSACAPTRVFDTELAGRLLGYAAGRARRDRRGGPRAHAWRRATRPPTGRPARCPSRGCATPRSTSRSWSSCATCSPPSSTSRASASWAEQEFAAIVAAPPAAAAGRPLAADLGLHRVRKRRQLAVVRALWERRDEVARRRDIAPGRVLPDSAIVAAALAVAAHRGGPGRAARLGRPLDAPADLDLAARHRRGPRAAGRATCPTPKTPHEGPPPARSWARPRPRRRRPAGGRPRPRSAPSPSEHRLPVENLLSPDTVRRLAWDPPPDADADGRGRVPAGARRPRAGRSG